MGFAVGGGILDPKVDVVALWEAFKRFDLDTPRVPNQSPTPISKSNDLRRPFDYIWGIRGPYFRPIWGVPGARDGPTNIHCVCRFDSCFIVFVRGPRFRALGVDSGPRGGAFEGVLDPQK